MNFYDPRSELRKMGTRQLLRTAADQKIQKCIIIGKPCRFLFRYRKFDFCASEMSGESCEIERLEEQEEVIQRDDEMISEQSIFQKPEER